MRNSARMEAEFDSLLTPVLGIAYGTAYRMIRNSDEAEDIVQTAAVAAFRAFTSFQPGTNFKAWFFRILVNSVRQYFRKRKREPEVVPVEDAPDLYLYVQTANAGLQKRNENPASLLIERLSEEQIQLAMEALPEEFRLVSVLYFMEELSYQEIAEILDCPVGTVRSRLHRARKLLQKTLWQLAEDNGIVTTLQGESGARK